MDLNLEQTIALLSSFPATLGALVGNLPEELLHANEGEGTWSPYAIAGHLIHGEKTDWIPRIRIILKFGDRQTFEPFDRDAQARESQLRPVRELLDEFAQLRAENVRELRSLNLRAEDLALRGKHPELGAVTLGQLIATWAAHDFTHLHQLSRVLAFPYRESTGPWSAYLGVLHCTGHSR